MNQLIKTFITLFWFLMSSLVCNAQCTGAANGCTPGVPHFIKLTGLMKNITAVPHPGIVAVKFVIYDAPANGNALWQEVQNVPLDAQGHYELMLGTTAHEGVPPELFTSGESRWLGVQALSPGSEEEPRVLMVSVPYALEAADAQTLGGLPASAFAKITASTVVEGAATVDSTSVSSAHAAAGSVVGQPSSVTPAVTGSLNSVPKFSTATSLVDSQITDSNGAVSLQNLANTLFADRFPGGVVDAVAACPASGCIINATSPNVNLNLGTIDPGTKAITIYLGPYNYTIKQVTLRKALKIIGMGASGGTNGSPTCSLRLPCNGTTLTSVNGNNPVFVIPQTNNTPATNILLSGFRVIGSAGNTSEDGFFLDTSSSLNSGLWFSTFDDVYLQGFSGIAIHVKGRNNDFASATQWVLFNNVIVFRTPGGGNGLRLEGATFELRFRNCEFDGQGLGDGTNIYIGGLTGGVNGYPISIAFEGLISQLADTAVQIDGAFNITFYGSHHEILWGGYIITNNMNIGVHGLTITDSYFAGNVGSHAGAGYALKIGTTVAFGIFFTHNELFGNPDSVVSGYNLASMVYQDNLYAGPLQAPPTSGITPQITPATAININGVHSVGLNTSATPILTIQSGLGPGEMVTFFTFGGPVTFAAGGNIDLMGASSITLTGTITFVRADLGGPLWKPVAQWTPPPAPAVKTAQSGTRN